MTPKAFHRLLERFRPAQAPPPEPMPEPEPPLGGYDRRRNAIPGIDPIADSALVELNALLPWKCFVVDSHGRRFGRPASARKREVPQPIPDRRIALLHERVGLADSTVLEIGCFEGVHTVGLARFARHVKACDGRMENVAKTAVRCAMFGVAAEIFLWDVEDPPPAGRDLGCDVLHHVGVLYHLIDPVRHLRTIVPRVGRALLLDTHVAELEVATESYTVDGRIWRFRRYCEPEHADAFSGLHGFARWLLPEDIETLLQESGFRTVDRVETRKERNGLRMLWMAER